jgi:hypothetical protein
MSKYCPSPCSSLLLYKLQERRKGRKVNWMEGESPDEGKLFIYFTEEFPSFLLLPQSLPFKLLAIVE